MPIVSMVNMKRVHANAFMGLLLFVNLTQRYYGEDCNDHCPGLIEGDPTFECNGNGECDSSTLTCQCENDSFDSTTCN